jgi:hyperosmotically inducible protein
MHQLVLEDGHGSRHCQLPVQWKQFDEELNMHTRGNRRVARYLQAVVLVGICGGAAMTVLGQTPPDNTKVNQRDRAKGAVTADQQKENATDRDLTQKVRRALMQDKTLSTYAHNVKIIAQNGNVTLKGPVRSEEERATVEAKATEVVGAGHVTNQMSVAPEKAKKKK